MRIHVAAGGSLVVLVAIIALFWSFPKLLVYVLLAVVAALAYGALYLILAAWMDPKDTRPTTVEIPTRPDDTMHDPTRPDVTGPDATAPKTPKPRRKSTKKPRAKKKTKKSP